jgi:hypothetical protein
VKVKLKNTDNLVPSNDLETIKIFLKFLQSEMALEKPITIVLSNQRKGEMTTGVRKNDEIIVLASNRLLIDILRTISHEWIHEYQFQKMGLSEKDVIKDIGGPEENMANTIAGVHIKKFAKKFPSLKPSMYGE